MSDGKASTEWQPSESNLAVLRAFQSHDYDCTVEAACIEAGFTRDAYYKMHDRPEFTQWWAEQADRFFRLQLARVQTATFKAATGKDAPGSSQDRKLFFERFDKDYCPRSRSEVAAQVEVTNGVDPTELCEAAAAAMSPRPDAEPSVAPVGADGGEEQQKPATPVD